MTAPRVSVVIPAYNRPAGLRRAVESVLAQTAPDLEVVIADDASGPDTEAVGRGFADPRVRYLRQPANVGIARNWGAGLAAARGEFVALLMDDDGYDPPFLADRLAALDRHPEAVMALSRHEQVFPDGRRQSAPLPADGPTILCGTDLLAFLLFRPWWIGSVLFRRGPLLAVWPAAERYGLVVDSGAALHLAVRPGATAVYLPAVSFWMTVHPQQTSHTRAAQMYQDAVRLDRDLGRGRPPAVRRLLARHTADCLTGLARAVLPADRRRAAGLLVRSFGYAPTGNLRHRLYLLARAAGLA